MPCGEQSQAKVTGVRSRENDLEKYKEIRKAGFKMKLLRGQKNVE
jgi:hypothetical protein